MLIGERERARIKEKQKKKKLESMLCIEWSIGTAGCSIREKQLVDQPMGYVLTLNWIVGPWICVIKSKQKLKEGQYKYNILEYNPVTNMKKINLVQVYHLSTESEI